MSGIIDKVKEKAKDVKDKVVDNTKDVADAAKDSFSAPTTSSSIAYFHSPESKYEGKENSNSAVEIKNADSPLMEDREREIMFSKNTKEDGLINTSTTSTSNIMTTANQINKQQQQQQQQQYGYKENNEFFNPFALSIKLWQNYHNIWINSYIEILKSFNRTISRNV